MEDLGSPSSEGLSDGFMETSLVGETMFTEDGKVKKHDVGKSFLMIMIVDSSNGMFSKFLSISYRLHMRIFTNRLKSKAKSMDITIT